MTCSASTTRARNRLRLSGDAIPFFCAVTAATFLASAAAPTPLHQHYAPAFDLGPGALTRIFAVYALSLLGALLTVGSLSDHIGQRPVILAAALVNAVAMERFIRAGAGLDLGIARAVQGFGTWMATTALGAAILDTDRRRGPVINSVTAFAGLLAGTLASGRLVRWAPAPTRLIYELLLALLVAQAFIVLLMPETTKRQPGASRSLLPELRLPKAARRSLLHVSPVNIAGWALGGLTFSLMPALVGLAQGLQAELAAPLIVATLIAGALVAIAGLRRGPAERVLLIGPMTLAGGVFLALAALSLALVWGLFAGVALAGFGFGAAFSGALRELLPKAGAEDRAGLIATFYVVSYLAFSLPVIAGGSAVPRLGLAPTAVAYGAVIVLLSSVSALLVRGRKTSGSQA